MGMCHNTHYLDVKLLDIYIYLFLYWVNIKMINYTYVMSILDISNMILLYLLNTGIHNTVDTARYISG